MNNVASMNPQIPAENARCAPPQDSWNRLAHQVGAELVKLGRDRAIRCAKGDELVGVLDDLARRGLVTKTRGGWYRITEKGLLAFPSERCARWRQAFQTGQYAAPGSQGFAVQSWIWVDLDTQRARACARRTVADDAAQCDVRPDAWARLFSHSAPCTPHRTPAEPFPSAPRGRVPVQIVYGARTNVTDQETVFGSHLISIEETLARAPARDNSESSWSPFRNGYWPGIGETDTWPAGRIGYAGHEVRRVYA